VELHINIKCIGAIAMFEKILTAGWGDMDFNSHMRNTAYLDKSVDVRLMHFAENGLPMSEFIRLKIGPVVMKDEIEYFKEFHLLDEMKVTHCLAGMSNDGSKARVRNEFFKHGKLAARVTSTLGWLDLHERKLIFPPEKILAALRAMDKTEDYQVFPDKRA
jgi:acyl-CoA thioester hydrolase